MRESKIQYNPAITVKENAKRNGVSEAAIRYYIKVNSLDRRFDRKQNIIDDCRKYLKKHPKATRTELQQKTGHSLSTIRYYWKYISTENELMEFDESKSKKRQDRKEEELKNQILLLDRIPINVIEQYLLNRIEKPTALQKSIPHLLPNALLGCACGDIIGSRFEFHNTKETDFELFNWRSRYTDDTCLTVCMCEWLLDDPAHKKETLAEKLVYYAKHFKQKCYGHKFKDWVNNPNRQIGQVSSSNGCAMRVSPIGWYAKSIEEAEELAEISASITHNHPDAIKGAKAVVDAIVLIREGNTKEEVKDYISGVFGYNLETSCDELRENTEWTSECSVCVPNAIRAFLESWDFESAIRIAVSLGGDSDTIAAMTGSMAEAYYGIPGNIRNVVAERIEKNPKFVEIINEFTRQYMSSKPE